MDKNKKIQLTKILFQDSITKKGGWPNAQIEFIQKFLGPLFHTIPDKVTQNHLTYMLNLFFNSETRELHFYRATKDFKLPGKKYVTATKAVGGLPGHHVKKDDLLLSVEDSTLDYVKLEIFKTRKDDNFQLTIPEWKWTLSKLRRI